MIRFNPASLIRRFAFAASGAAGVDARASPRTLLHRSRCASAILRRAAALSCRFRPGPWERVAAFVLSPWSIDLSSAICWLILDFCDLNPSIAARMMVSRCFRRGMFNYLNRVGSDSVPMLHLRIAEANDKLHCTNTVALWAGGAIEPPPNCLKFDEVV